MNQNGKQGKNGHCDDGSSVTTVSSPEPEEYTYERAIQGYVNFAETRVKSRTPVTRSNLNNSRNQLDTSNSSESGTAKLSNGHSAKGLPSPPHTPRRQSGAKIEEKLSALEKRRNSSTEINNSVNSDKKVPVAKGDVLKRREMFERACELSEQISKPARRLSEDNQERLPHSENKGEAVSVKERASQMSSENINRKDSALLRHRFSNGDVSSAVSVQERLSQLGKQGEEKDQVSEDLSQSVKKRLSNLDSAYNKGDSRNITPDKDNTFETKLANFSTEESVLNGIGDVKGLAVGSVRSSSPEEDVLYETKRQQFHRSLDSLDVEGSSDVGNDSFGRVQSLEDLDCCSHARNYPASASSTEILVFSSQSGDTDRDDSGIHTADVSCSVSQADEPVDDGEIVATINSVVPRLETSSTGVDVYHLEVEIVNQKHVGRTVIDQKRPVAEPSDNVAVAPLDMATAFLDVRENLGSPLVVEAETSMPQTPETRNNPVSPQFDMHSLMIVVEKNENVLFSHYIGASIISAEFSSVEGESTIDIPNSCKQNDTTNLTCLQIVLPQLSEQTYEAVETHTISSYTHFLTKCFVCMALMQNKDSVPSQGKASVKDKRKTVVEVCEKMIFDGHGIIGGVQSPPPTPYIEVPNTRLIPFQVSHVHTKSYCPLFVSNVKWMFSLR